MNTFVENFKEQWGKSFGEDHAPVLEVARKLEEKDPWAFAEDGGSAALWTALEKNAPKPEYSSIIKRIWNDAVLGGENKSLEHETPLIIAGARGVGKTLGIGTALATVGTVIAGLFTSTSAIPVLPVIGTFMGLGGLGGAIYGLFTKPEAKQPYERLVHIDRGAGVRNYFMETVQPPPPNWKDKASHVMECADYGWKLPMVAAYRVINTPIRLTGYAAHAFTTAVKAAIETCGEDDTPPPPSPSGNLPAPQNDFTM